MLETSMTLPFKTATQTLLGYLCSASATVKKNCSHSFQSVLMTLNNNNNKQYLWSQEELVATSNTQQVKDDVSHSKVKTFLKKKMQPFNSIRRFEEEIYNKAQIATKETDTMDKKAACWLFY